MRKKVITVIVLLAVVAALIGTVILLSVLNKKEEEEIAKNSKVSESTMVDLIVEDRINLEYLKVKNSTGDYNIYRIGENAYTVEGFEGLPQTTYEFFETFAMACNVIASKVLEEDCQDLAKFGLDDPDLVFEVKIEGKDPQSISVGDMSSDGSTRYVSRTGENTVYSFASTTFKNLYYSKFDYLETLMIDGFDMSDPEQIPKIDTISITRPDLEKPMKFEQFKKGEIGENAVSQSYVKMVSPVTALISETPAQDYFYGNFGLTAEKVVEIRPDEEMLKKYGFDKPSSVFELTYDKNINIMVTTGNGIECTHSEDEDLENHQHKIVAYYAMLAGTDLIYEVKTESMRWFKMMPKDILSSYAVLPSVFDLESVDLTTGGKTYKLKYEADIDEKKVVSATIDGKTVDAEPARSLLQLIGSTSVIDINTKQHNAKPSTVIKYNYKNGKADTVELFVLEDRTCVVSLNGNNSLTGRAGLVDKIEKETKNLLDGKSVNVNW